MNDEIVKCTNCEKDINLAEDAQTYCSECKKDFCFGLNQQCFSEYHIKNKIYHHFSLSITNPRWKINLALNQTNDKNEESK